MTLPTCRSLNTLQTMSSNQGRGMMKTVTTSLVTVAIAAAGFYLGTTIHGASWLAFVSTVAGGAGGCLASVAAFDVWRTRRRVGAEQ